MSFSTALSPSRCRACVTSAELGRRRVSTGVVAMGLKEQIVFPEIVYDKVDQIRGMDIVFVTTAKTDAEAKALLKKFDIPFQN